MASWTCARLRLQKLKIARHQGTSRHIKAQSNYKEALHAKVQQFAAEPLIRGKVPLLSDSPPGVMPEEEALANAI